MYKPIAADSVGACILELQDRKTALTNIVVSEGAAQLPAVEEAGINVLFGPSPAPLAASGVSDRRLL